MRKLSLNLDDLRVQSFSTTPLERRASGTVRGHDVSNDLGSCWEGTDTTAEPSDLVVGCSEFNTCVDGCGGGGGASGHMTCGNGGACTPGYTDYETCASCAYKWCV